VAGKLRFYLDENLPVEIARQLKLRGIDAITARDLGLLGVADEEHLAQATELQRVLCTYDSDYLQLAAEGAAHAGVVFGQQDSHYLGDWVNWLSLMHAVYTPDEMVSRIEFL
jgi:hypothetical protein